MKMIYQQLLAFFVVIAFIILLLGFSFSRMSKAFVYDSTWQRLENYSDSLIQQSLIINKKDNSVSFNNLSLKTSEAMLDNQSAHFTIFSAKKQVLFPNDGISTNITKSDWNSIKNGRIVRKISNRSKKMNDGKTRPAMIEVVKPYYYNKKLVAAVVTGSFVSNLNSNVKRINRNLLVGLVVALVISMVVSLFLASRMNRRVAKLRSAAKQVANGNYDIQLPNRGNDEISQLIGDFNHMTSSLKEANQEIERQEERRQEFLADAAHEMRTPLTTISGILEGIRYDVIPTEARDKSFELMNSETQRLIRLVNDNLDYEKIRTNSIQLDRINFNAYNLITNVVEQLSNKAKDAGDELIIKSPKELPVYADYDRFSEIIINIVNNALQFTENGTVTIIGERGFNETIIRIADTGIGMSEEQKRNIFERYYKADASRRSGEYGESGLGLAIVHQLVKQHGGTISVQSTLDEGTTFIIVFPDEGHSKSNPDSENQAKDIKDGK
ncbi:sensor histidine kinase [Lentilactobacillus sp. SPB1-3]|uniref:ATP-binding protein n=1 Tax=Lentilactobacillus terminaliae TaxID=3003483 RepID=A0ACD5DDR9_9LACO|nr:HAMP domain-containing sensor histidine kinase [Lentilactobacillus sp. SPB1-3]MCZ0977437.1 HAMP domain-containing sensor histidine kinase [Lentilactobacillus sp. SPB1-3]